MKQENKSIYSLNTQPNLNSLSHHEKEMPNNLLASFYKQLLPQHSLEYPYLSKIIYLQLILRENIILLTNRRAQVKDIWKSISKKLYQQRPNIFVIDQTTKIQEILQIKSQYNLTLIYDLSKLSNSNLNRLLNYEQEFSFLVIQQENIQLSSELSGIFSLCFLDQKEQDFIQMISMVHQKHNLLIQKQKFNQMIRTNFEMTLQNQEDEGFLRPYLICLKDNLQRKKLNLAHSKWKKVIKILQFIGISKQQGTFKKLNLTDCCLTPNLLASSLNELQIISKANEEVILSLLPFYGCFKFLSSIQTHFWLPNSKKTYFKSLAEKMLQHVSFFYPCTKYPQTARIQIQNLQPFYRVKGYEKKLMSDKYIQINTNSKYSLNLEYRSSSKVIIHIGLACFDENKVMINPIQVCRIYDSMIKVIKIEGNKIYSSPQTEANLLNWNVKRGDQNCFAYEKCIGIYQHSKTDQVLSMSSILVSQNSYKNDSHSGIYTQIQQNFIELSQQGMNKLKIQFQGLRLNQNIILMNHIQKGSYVIGQTVTNQTDTWNSVNINFSGQEWDNNGKQFLMGTKFVRVMVMLNFNSGHPEYKIQNKSAQIDLKNIKWNQIIQ